MKISSWSNRKFISGICFFIIGVLNIVLLEDAATIYFITAFPYYYLTGYPYVIAGILLIAYQIMSYRQYLVEINKETKQLYIKEIYPLKVWKRDFTFKIDELTKIRFENSEVIGELIPLAVNWTLIWFFTREGMISIQNYFLMEAPLLLKIGLILVITHICVTFFYLMWMFPVGRYQLRIEDRDRVLLANFGNLKKVEIEALNRTLELTSSPSNRENDQKQSKKSEQSKNSSGSLRFILWKYSFILLGSLLSGISIFLMISEVGWYFTMGQFSEIIIGFLGMRYVIYGFNRHYYTSEQLQGSFLDKRTSQIQSKSIFGFKTEIIFQNDDQTQDKEGLRNQSSNRIAFRQSGPFEIVFIGLLFAIVIYQGFRTILNPTVFLMGDYSYPLILYQIGAILIISAMIIVLFLSYRPIGMKTEQWFKNPAILKRIVFVAILLGIPTILIAAGIPIVF